MVGFEIYSTIKSRFPGQKAKGLPMMPLQTRHLAIEIKGPIYDGDTHIELLRRPLGITSLLRSIFKLFPSLEGCRLVIEGRDAQFSASEQLVDPSVED